MAEEDRPTNEQSEETSAGAQQPPVDESSAGDPAAASPNAAEEAIDEVQSAVDELNNDGDDAAAQPSDENGQPLNLPSFDPRSSGELSSRIDFLSEVNLRVKVELGRTRMYVEDVLRLNEGSVVELDKPAGDPVDIYVNDRHVARGEVLVVNDNFCVRVSEVIQQTPTED